MGAHRRPPIARRGRLDGRAVSRVGADARPALRGQGGRPRRSGPSRCRAATRSASSSRASWARSTRSSSSRSPRAVSTSRRPASSTPSCSRVARAGPRSSSSRRTSARSSRCRTASSSCTPARIAGEMPVADAEPERLGLLMAGVANRDRGGDRWLRLEPGRIDQPALRAGPAPFEPVGAARARAARGAGSRAPSCRSLAVALGLAVGAIAIVVTGGSVVDAYRELHRRRGRHAQQPRGHAGARGADHRRRGRARARVPGRLLQPRRRGPDDRERGRRRRSSRSRFPTLPGPLLIAALDPRRVRGRGALGAGAGLAPGAVRRAAAHHDAAAQLRRGALRRVPRLVSASRPGRRCRARADRRDPRRRAAARTSRPAAASTRACSCCSSCRSSRGGCSAAPSSATRCG